MLLALRRHPYLAGAFALAAVATLVFLIDVVGGVISWSSHEDEPIEPWMTVGYIGRSWDLDPRTIDEVAGLPMPEVAGRPLTLQEIARRRGIRVEVVIAEVEAALATLRSRDRPPGDGGRTTDDDGADGP